MKGPHKCEAEYELMLRLMFDQERHFSNEQVASWCEDRGMEHDFSVSYDHQGNGWWKDVIIPYSRC